LSKGNWVMRINAGTQEPRRLGLTPLIDVIFLLLLFFMLSSNFLKFSEVDVEGAQQGQQAAGDIRAAMLRVHADGRIDLNGAAVSIGALLEQLDVLSSGRATTLAVLAGDGASVQNLVAVLEVAKKSKFKTITLVP